MDDAITEALIQLGVTSDKLEYAQRFFVLYENIMENSRKENKQLTEKIKELENQIKLNKKD